MLTDTKFALLLQQSESRRLEFKKSMTWQQAQYKIVKTSLAMSNTRDGGVMIFGVEEVDNKMDLVGVTNDDLRTFNEDDIRDFVNKYADPPIEPSLEFFNSDAKSYIAILIPEFADEPIICRRDHPQESLKKGAIYCRPVGKAESRCVNSHAESRAILDVAIVKKLRGFLETAQRSGIELSQVAKASAVSEYEAELGDM